MQEVITSTLTCLASGIIGYGFFVLKENRKMKTALKEKEAEKQEALEKQRLELLETVDRAQSKEIELMVELNMADIKQYLYDMHDKYNKRGYMPGFLKETLQAKYKYYKAHGGNGHGEYLYNKLMNLPEEPAE